MTIISKKHGDHRRGFAMLAAIGLLAITGAALLAIGTLVARDVRRTTTARQDAQLRQLLLAGAAAVQDRAAGWPDRVEKQEFDILLPASLSDGQSRVQMLITPSSQTAAAEITAEITAHHAGRPARQRIHLQRTGNAWRITEALLNPTDPAATP